MILRRNFFFQEKKSSPPIKELKKYILTRKIKNKIKNSSETYGKKIFWLRPNEGYADPLPLSFDPTFLEDAQCAEMNEKTIFRLLRFLFLELS